MCFNTVKRYLIADVGELFPDMKQHFCFAYSCYSLDSGMNQIMKAGVVIVRSNPHEKEILLVFRGRQGDWSFPKGHCEQGESFEQAAVREIQEETGLEIRFLQQLPDIMYKDSKGEEVVLRMYLGTPQDNSPKERAEKADDRVEWIPVSKVESTLSYQNLKEYFSSIKSILR